MPSAIWLRAELPVHKIKTRFFSAITFTFRQRAPQAVAVQAKLHLFRAATMKKHIAAISAEQGTVITQAQTTLLATPQRTAESRRVAPTPMIAPVIVCVVLTGIP